MRLDCKVLLLKRSDKRRGLVPRKALITLKQKKIKGVTLLSLKISTKQNGNRGPIKISRKNVLDVDIYDDSLTIEFKTPKMTLYITEGNPAKLRVLRKLILSLNRGEKVERSQLEEMMVRYFPPPKYARAFNLKDYFKWSSRGYPDYLTEITINGCELKMIDDRLFQCKNLITLDLSKNLLGLEAKEVAKLLRLLSELINLKKLFLSHNFIQELPHDIDLPQSLKFVNLSDNQLSYFPKSILKLSKLQSLNISHNEIVQVPQELVWLPLTNLNLGDNKIQYLPYYFNRKKLESCSIRGNDPGTSYKRNPCLTKSTLSALTFAKTKEIKYQDSYIPLNVRGKESELLRRCSVCEQFFAKDDCYERAVSINPLHFATSVDDQASFPVQVIACRKYRKILNDTRQCGSGI